MLLSAKRSRSASSNRTSASTSYLVESPKETACLAHVDAFYAAFVAKNPKRAPLLLAPANEFGVRKFVCTTLAPTKLPYPSIYGAEACAKFTAQLIDAELLEHPASLPSYLPSPTFVLQSFRGDSFDISTLLCSFLIGAGYDAYCVSGYAPLNTCHADTSNEPAPADIVSLKPIFDGFEVPTNEHAAASGGSKREQDALKQQQAELDRAVLGVDNVVRKGKDDGEGPATWLEAYGITTPAKIDSDFLALRIKEKIDAEAAILLDATKSIVVSLDQEESDDEYVETCARPAVLTTATQARIAAATAATAEGVEDEAASQAAAEASSTGKSVHSWVLIVAGQKDVASHFFIDALTGRTFPVAAAATVFSGIETVWSHKNLWVNMQEDVAVEDMLFDLSAGDASWLPVIPAPVVVADDVDQGHGHGHGHGHRASVSLGSSSPRGSPRNVSPRNKGRTPRHGMGRLHSMSKGGAAALLASQAAEKNANGDDAAALPTMGMPPSWVVDLNVTEKTFRHGMPTYRKEQTRYYSKVRVETFAAGARADCMQTCVTRYGDVARSFKLYVIERFKSRSDNLIRRVSFWGQQNRMLEEFAPGRTNKLWILEQVPGRWRRLRFHCAGRIDGLMERFECVGLPITMESSAAGAAATAAGPETEALVQSASERWATESRAKEELPSFVGSLSQRETQLGIWERYTRRDDRMTCRSALLLKTCRSSAGLRKLAAATGDRVVERMRMQFSRDNSSDSVDDIANVIFNLVPTDNASIAIQCHNAQGSILDSHRTFDTAKFANPTMSDAHLNKSGGRRRKGKGKGADDDAMKVFVEPELIALRAMETECYEGLRESKRATDEILFKRSVEENCAVGRPGSPPRADALGLGSSGAAVPGDAVRELSVFLYFITIHFVHLYNFINCRHPCFEKLCLISQSEKWWRVGLMESSAQSLRRR